MRIDRQHGPSFLNRKFAVSSYVLTLALDEEIDKVNWNVTVYFEVVDWVNKNLVFPRSLLVALKKKKGINALVITTMLIILN